MGELSGAVESEPAVRYWEQIGSRSCGERSSQGHSGLAHPRGDFMGRDLARLSDSEFGAELSRRLERLNAAESRVLEVMGPQVGVMTGPRAARRCLAELDEACASLDEGWDEKTRRKDIRPGRA